MERIVFFTLERNLVLPYLLERDPCILKMASTTFEQHVSFRCFSPLEVGSIDQKMGEYSNKQYRV
jgi:hypothetical protein